MAETPQPTPEEIATSTPFHQNEVDPTTITDEYPPDPNQNLEQEDNYTKPENINRLVDEVLSGQFEYNMRNKRYREIYGKDMRNGFCLKAWLAGEGRLVRDQQNGGYQMVGGDFRRVEDSTPITENPFENPYPDPNAQIYSTRLEYNRANEIIRRGVSVGIKLARQVGITVALSTITGGGIGAAFYWATGGATIGRGIVEGIRIAGQEEIKTREKIEIAKIRYFKKARELASRVGKPYSPETAEGKTENDYNMIRSAAIMDLVNFVYSYENLGVDVEYDDRGRPYVETEVRGTPLPERTGPEATQDPRQGINRGPAYNRGTEVYQPSPVAADVERVRDLEDKLAETSKKWDKRVELGGLVGGLAGVGAGILRSSSEWVQNAYNEFQTRLQNGEIVKLNIDSDWIHRHGVQKLTEKVGKMGDRFVYHMRNIREHLDALRQGAEVLDPAAKFTAMKEVAGQAVDKLGVHTLGETASRINAAVLVESGKHILYKVLQNVAAIGLNTFWERRNEICRVKQVKEHRDKFVKTQEQLRRRHQPAEVLDILKARAETEHKIFPEPNQTWVQLLNDGTYHRIKILQVEKNGDAVIQHYDNEVPLNKTDSTTLQDIMDNYNLLTIREEAEKVPPQKPDAPPAPPTQPTPPAGPDTEPLTGDGNAPTPDNPDNGDGGNGPDQKPDDAKKKEEEEKKEEGEKGPKVTIKTEKEAAKEIEVKNGQVLIVTRKGNGPTLSTAYEVLIDANSGVVTTKGFIPDKNNPQKPFYPKNFQETHQTIQAFQQWLDGKDVRTGGGSVSEYLENLVKKRSK